MKNYFVSETRFDRSKDYETAIVTITNSDEYAIIRYLTFFETHLGPNEIRFSLQLAFQGSTVTYQTKAMFESLGGNYLNRLNVMVISSNNIKVIENFFDYSQTIDPIPLRALNQLKGQLHSFDFLNNEKIKTLVADGKHGEALELTLEYDAEGDDNALIFLINLYETNKDITNYYHVLSRVPSTHPSFVNANLELFEYDLSTPPVSPNNSPNEKIAYLERLFRHALNAEFYDQASCYFDELCGNSGITPEINPIKGEADTLILIARKQRRIHAEIEYLKSNLFLDLEGRLTERPDGEEKSKMTADFIALLIAIKNKVDFDKISKGSGITDYFYTEMTLKILHISKLENRDPNIILHGLFNAYIQKLNSIPVAEKNETQHLISDGLKLNVNTFYRLHSYLKNTHAFEPNHNEKKVKNLDDFLSVIGIAIPTEKDSLTDYRKALRQKAKQYSPYAPLFEREHHRYTHTYNDDFSGLMSELYTKKEDTLVSERKAYEAALERQHKVSLFAAKIRERLMSERQQQFSANNPIKLLTS